MALANPAQTTPRLVDQSLFRRLMPRWLRLECVNLWGIKRQRFGKECCRFGVGARIIDKAAKGYVPMFAGAKGYLFVLVDCFHNMCVPYVCKCRAHGWLPLLGVSWSAMFKERLAEQGRDKGVPSPLPSGGRGEFLVVLRQEFKPFVND